METYEVPLVPGPTMVSPEVLAAYRRDFGSPDLEPEYARLYAETQELLRRILGTRNRFAIMTGEGMLALWAGLKSCLRSGDTVLAVSTGPFGAGIAEMAQTITPRVVRLDFAYHEVADLQRVEEAILKHRPKMLTLVHCETPCGTLNPLEEIGALVRKRDVPLFYVDAVSSAGGVPLAVDECRIDLGLFGTQKCFSCPPNLALVSVSDRAWEIIAEVNYQGYDALQPWRTALGERYFPYTPYWHGLAALHCALTLLLEEGLERVYQRHAEAAAYCRERAQQMGLELFPAREEYCSPTVTALKVPSEVSWTALDRALRAQGVVVGGSWGKLQGKVFRIGHLGTQAQRSLVARGMAVLERVLGTLRPQ
ncbi:MAG TPA: alanine--glyoxylate aminotransferase family protein [Armatimonadetes bacterium]|nr:alanine--glyoxylate aminotransferase family protein [Armatimonadota bacterium]